MKRNASARRTIANPSVAGSTGGSKPPEELAAIVGLDLADPGLWDSGIDALAAELDEAEALAAEIGLGS